MITKKRLNIAG